MTTLVGAEEALVLAVANSELEAGHINGRLIIGWNGCLDVRTGYVHTRHILIRTRYSASDYVVCLYANQLPCLWVNLRVVDMSAETRESTTVEVYWNHLQTYGQCSLVACDVVATSMFL